MNILGALGRLAGGVQADVSKILLHFTECTAQYLIHLTRGPNSIYTHLLLDA